MVRLKNLNERIKKSQRRATAAALLLLQRPSELAAFTRDAGLEMIGIKGLSYNPLTQVYSLGDDVDVNYMIAVKK